MCKTSFFLKCADLVVNCKEAHLPKLATDGGLYFARIGEAYHGNCRMLSQDVAHSDQIRKQSMDLLEDALKLCMLRFSGHERLQAAVETLLGALRKSCEELTSEELASIKKAMLESRSGLATHSGHWYDCVNGHPVSNQMKRHVGAVLIIWM